MKMLLERKSILARDLALLDFWDVTNTAQGDRQDHSLHQKIARIKLAHSRSTEWAPTTDKDDLRPDGAKA